MNTKKIELDIYKEKLPDFYASLMKMKVESILNQNFEYSEFVNSIEFNFEKFNQFLSVDFSFVNGLELQIYNFLIEQSKYSEFYKLISENSFDEFSNSKFVKELEILIYFLTFSNIFEEKNNSVEVQNILIQTSKTISDFANSIGHHIGLMYSIAFPLVSGLQKMEGQSFRISHLKDNIFYYKSGNEEIPFELFFKDGLVYSKIDNLESYVNHKINGEILLQNLEKTFVTIENIKFVTVSDNYVFENGNLQINNQITIKSIDGFIENVEKISENEVEITVKSTGNPEIYIDNWFKDKINFEENKEITLQLYTQLSKLSDTFLQKLSTKGKNLGKRDLFVYLIYSLLKKYYPNLSNHLLSIVSGFISSTLGLLNRYEEYIDSEIKKISYNQYLLKTVKNIHQKFT